MVTQNTLSVLQLTSQDLTSQKMWNSMLTVTGFLDILKIVQYTNIEDCSHVYDSVTLQNFNNLIIL